MKTHVQLWPYPSEFFLEYKSLQTKVAEKNKTHISFLFFPGKDCSVSEKVEKYGRASQAIDYNTARAG